MPIFSTSKAGWIDASSTELEIQKYTHYSFLRWNVTLLNDTTYRCIDERNAEVSANATFPFISLNFVSNKFLNI